MKLHDFLSLIEDEEARIELMINNRIEDDECQECNFWLSDYLTNNDNIGRKYKDYKICGFSFFTNENQSDIAIEVKEGGE